jgi:esterase
MMTEAAVRDRDITVNDLRLHYREWGDASAPSLVLLHGFTGHAASWDTFAEAMSNRFHVFALDQRGHGDSEWASDYAPDRRVEDLEAFVTQLGLAPFALLGLSMGGACAYGYAVKHPEALTKLVIVDISPTLETAGSQRIGAGVQAKDEFDSVDEAVAQARLGNPLAPDDALRYRVTHNLKQLPDGKWTFKYDVTLRRGGGRNAIPRADPATIWPTLAAITCPTLFVRGAESDLTSRASAERMRTTLPNCTVVEVERAGHSVPLDNPPGFLAAVGAWL